MKILALVASKGGVGKTSLAAHMAVEGERRGLSVAAIDLDPQGSLTRWAESREADTPALIPATTESLAERLEQISAAGADLVIIDTPPGHMATLKASIACADLALIPVTPSPVDILAIGPTVEAAKQKPMLFVLNRADMRRRATMEAGLLLSQHGRAAPAPIRDLAAFAASMTDGRTAQELEPKGAAAQDIAALFDAVAQELKL